MPRGTALTLRNTNSAAYIHAQKTLSIANFKLRYSVEREQARIHYLAQCDQL